MRCDNEKRVQDETIYSDIISNLIDDNYEYEGLNVYLKNKGISIENDSIDIDSLHNDYLRYRKPKTNKRLYISKMLKPIDSDELKILKDERKLSSIYVFEDKEEKLLDLDLVQSKKFDLKSMNNDINFDLDIGAIEFSRVYFNLEKNQGILYFKFLCGNLCGNESYIFINKENNHWKITKKELIASY
ncbi:hypothetical protein GCM10022397_15540 [Flavivirga jejuensis]